MLPQKLSAAPPHGNRQRLLLLRHSRESGNPEPQAPPVALDARLRGHDDPERNGVVAPDRARTYREKLMSGPLAGIRVIEVAIAVLGPLATQILGDMGAEVIKVETPDGDPMRQIGPARHPGMAAYFLNINRNKRSLVLDLKRPAAREALLKLVETADVLVHNMRLGAAERLGLD